MLDYHFVYPIQNLRGNKHVWKIRKRRVSKMKEILTDKERNALVSMTTYWREVRQREDTTPLSCCCHLQQEKERVQRMLGTRLLDIVEEYLDLTKGRARH